MMVPSISIIEKVENHDLIFIACAVVDGEVLTVEERTTELMRRGIPAGILNRQLRKSVAHQLLEKMMNEVVDPE